MTSYTPNQTGAIACLLGINMWAFTAYAVASFVSSITPWFYLILMIMGWALLLFYIKLLRHAFIIGLFVTILAMTYLPVTPILYGGTKWFLFTRGLYDFTVILFYLIGLAHIYLCYKSYREVLI